MFRPKYFQCDSTMRFATSRAFLRFILLMRKGLQPCGTGGQIARPILAMRSNPKNLHNVGTSRSRRSNDRARSDGCLLHDDYPSLGASCARPRFDDNGAFSCCRPDQHFGVGLSDPPKGSGFRSISSCGSAASVLAMTRRDVLSLYCFDGIRIDLVLVHNGIP